MSIFQLLTAIGIFVLVRSCHLAISAIVSKDTIWAVLYGIAFIVLLIALILILGNPVVLKKHSPETVKTSVICTEGNIRYWIKWSEGILRKDSALTTMQALAQKILALIDPTEQLIEQDGANDLAASVVRKALVNNIKQLCEEEVKR